MSVGLLTTNEMVDMSGLSFRQIDRYEKQGILTCTWEKGVSGSGYNRRWHDNELAKARLIKDLLELGVSIERIKEDGDPQVTLRNLRKAMK